LPVFGCPYIVYPNSNEWHFYFEDRRIGLKPIAGSFIFIPAMKSGAIGLAIIELYLM
jgi:hypothetical protein